MVPVLKVAVYNQKQFKSRVVVIQELMIGIQSHSAWSLSMWVWGLDRWLSSGSTLYYLNNVGQDIYLRWKVSFPKKRRSFGQRMLKWSLVSTSVERIQQKQEQEKGDDQLQCKPNYSPHQSLEGLWSQNAPTGLTQVDQDVRPFCSHMVIGSG